MERWQSHPLNQKSRQTKESWPSGDDYSSGEQQLAGVRVYVRDYGVPTFKIFMNNRGGEGARLGLPDVDDGFLFRLCEAAAGSDGMVGFLSEIHALKVDLYLHQQGIDTTTPAGKAMFQMMGVFAEFEPAMIRERIRAGLARAKDEGKTLGRPR
jgi:Resolvase, N terminal domain